MTAANFPACLDLVLELEGGFSDDPQDPGGATNLGVTAKTWSAWIGHQANRAEIEALSRADVTPLYEKQYWRPTGCDDWATGVDLAVFDPAVNMGPGTAIRFLQQAAGVDDDGKLGPATAAAVARLNAGVLINRICAQRTAYYRKLSTFPRFGKGWLNRVSTVQARALAMAGEAG
jgi:lysozyme family protein